MGNMNREEEGVEGAAGAEGEAGWCGILADCERHQRGRGLNRGFGGVAWPPSQRPRRLKGVGE
jgi:hypothetical protein